MRPHLLVPVVLAALLAPAPDAGALQLCAQKVRATADVRDGSSLRLRTACRANEIAVDPAIFDATGPVETHSFSSETVLRGTATLYLTTNGRIDPEEHHARTPLGAGTLRNLRCYLPEQPGGGGIRATVGAGPCAAPLAYGGPSVSFSATDGQVAKDSGSATLTVAAGSCIALRVELLGTTNATYLNCTLERIPG
jgi:hypothetical protein